MLDGADGAAQFGAATQPADRRIAGVGPLGLIEIVEHAVAEPAGRAEPLTVIAGHRVGAKRRPMTGSAKQSIAPRKKEWIASSQALLAMTAVQIANAVSRSRDPIRPSC
jgi:hypothetical protein